MGLPPVDWSSVVRDFNWTVEFSHSQDILLHVVSFYLHFEQSFKIFFSVIGDSKANEPCERAWKFLRVLEWIPRFTILKKNVRASLWFTFY